MNNTGRQEERRPEFISVYFYGKRYDVPGSFTIMQAYEFTGHQYTRGCGCRGGVCGACGALFLTPGSLSIQVGLACQTQVIAEMSVIQIPYFPTKSAHYEVEDVCPDTASILRIYPDLLKCMGCNTCTKMCPQNIDVMGCMSATLRGDITAVAEASVSCVMCGLCAARCPAEIVPYNILLLNRRIYGRHILQPSKNLAARLEEIERGKFDGELDNLMKLGVDELKALYVRQQEDKRIA